MWIYCVLIGILFLTTYVWKLTHPSRKKIPNYENQNLNIFSLKHKNAVISGEFFPTDEETLKNKLINAKTNVMPQICAETDILICGKFPDWSLIEEARLKAINIIFIDKASDLFTNSTSAEHNNFESEQMHISQVHLGI